MRKAEGKRDPASPRGARIDAVPSGRPANFLAANLIALVNYMRRVGTLRFRRKYDLSLVEGWMVARLGAGAPMSIDQLAARAGLAQSQVSRAVSVLVTRGLIVRGTSLSHYREARLELSPRGRAIYADIMADAPDYERRLTAGLGPADIEMLSHVLPRLIANADANLREEAVRASGGAARAEIDASARASRPEEGEHDEDDPGHRRDRQYRRGAGRPPRAQPGRPRARARAQRGEGETS